MPQKAHVIWYPVKLPQTKGRRGGWRGKRRWGVGQERGRQWRQGFKQRLRRRDPSRRHELADPDFTDVQSIFEGEKLRSDVGERDKRDAIEKREFKVALVISTKKPFVLHHSSK
jgi:hypothetical protein